MSILALPLSPGPTAAIVIEPSTAQVAAALEQGRSAAVARVPPDRLYAWFGSLRDLEPKGFLMTKIVGLRVMSAHFALRSQTPSEPDIQQVLGETTFLINVMIFGDRPTIAAESTMVLKQGDRVIKPQSVRFDGQAARTMVWPHQPAYQAKVIASFPYAEIDPHAETRLSVYSGAGEISFDLNFVAIE